jgi:hypothetical protein
LACSQIEAALLSGRRAILAVIAKSLVRIASLNVLKRLPWCSGDADMGGTAGILRLVGSQPVHKTAGPAAMRWRLDISCDELPPVGIL